MDRGQEQSHLIIEIHCDHETYFGKEKKMFTHLQIPRILNKTTVFPLISSKTCDVQKEEAESSSSFMLQNNFICPEFSFIKFQGFVPSSVLLSNLCFFFFCLKYHYFNQQEKQQGKVQCRVRKPLKHTIKSTKLFFSH